MQKKNLTRTVFPVIFLVSIVLQALSPTASQAGAIRSPGAAVNVSSEKPPVDVYVGVYVIRIPALSFRDNQWTVDAYVWFRWSGDLVPPPQQTFELCNGTIEKKEVTDAKKVRLKTGNKEKEYQYACIRIQATVTCFWDVSRYPFDKHALSLVMEDTRESSSVHYVADKDACVVDNDCTIPGWNLGRPDVKSCVHTYPTSYGEPPGMAILRDLSTAQSCSSPEHSRFRAARLPIMANGPLGSRLSVP